MISPYVRRLRLASELLTLREKAGLTHEELAVRIGESRAKISRLENSRIPPAQDDIIKLLDALGVDGEKWTQIVTIAREAAEKGWWEPGARAMGARQALYADLEAGAVAQPPAEPAGAATSGPRRGPAHIGSKPTLS